MQNYKLFLLAMLFSFPVFAQEKLNEVKVVKKQKGIKKSYKVTENVSTLTTKELAKAACCNLAESFETNPSIDVNFSDAVTGTKQIKLLGLTSPYLMITEENIPSVRGASQAYGMTFTPGTWVESIQITKGAGSVVNGYESISGQINTELFKPLTSDKMYFNVYGATDSRIELNTQFSKALSDKWGTSLFIHGNNRLVKNDMNHDGFLDNPLGSQINILNRYQYSNPETGLVSFVNFRYLNDKKVAGEVDFDKKVDKGTTNHWGSEINTERFDVATKIGYVFPDQPYQSIGFQNAFNVHNQQSYFGLNQFDIKQNSFYSNLIFNSIIDNTKNKFSAGLNFTFDQYQEFVNAVDWSRRDNSVGAFFEYTYDNADNFSLVLGGRVDNHNRLGTFFTPRLHMRYNPWENSVLRLSVGRGKRAANIFAENQALFASSRTFTVLDTDGKIYGLNPEIAWNYGLSFSQKFHIFNRSSEVVLDFYRTDFSNKAVVDVMQSPQEVLFYNLKGNSFANSLQVEFNVEPINRLNVRTAYKYYDVETDYLSGSYQNPLQAKHRFFTNLEYETALTDSNKQWRFDFTFNRIGKQQLPLTISNPVGEQLPDFSAAYSLMNAQVTHVFSKAFEVYVGGENIGNYKQSKAILGVSDPFGPHFDASIVYAPVFGQMYYAGLRFKVN